MNDLGTSSTPGQDIVNQDNINNTQCQSDCTASHSQNDAIASSTQIQSAIHHSQCSGIGLYSTNDVNSNRSSSTAINNTHIIPNIPKRYSISKSKKLSDTRQACRTMALDPISSTAYISFQQSHQYGITALNMFDMSQSPIMPIHDGLVRDLQYSDRFLLSTSMDKTLKLTSTASQEPGISIPLTAPGWSCCFSESNTNKVYCGLADSSIVVYDIRNIRTYESLLCSPHVLSKTPIHSMFVKRNPLGRPTVYCSNLMETFIWDDNQTLKVIEQIEEGMTVNADYFEPCIDIFI